MKASVSTQMTRTLSTSKKTEGSGKGVVIKAASTQDNKTKENEVNEGKAKVSGVRVKESHVKEREGSAREREVSAKVKEAKDEGDKHTPTQSSKGSKALSNVFFQLLF